MILRANIVLKKLIHTFFLNIKIVYETLVRLNIKNFMNIQQNLKNELHVICLL